MQIYLQSTVYLCGDTKHLANHIIFFWGGGTAENNFMLVYACCCIMCCISLGSESRMYEFPSGNFLLVNSEVVIMRPKLGQADSTPSFLHMTIWRQRKQCSVVYVLMFFLNFPNS